jgi:hypothetical protein
MRDQIENHKNFDKKAKKKEIKSRRIKLKIIVILLP